MSRRPCLVNVGLLPSSGSDWWHRPPTLSKVAFVLALDNWSGPMVGIELLWQLKNKQRNQVSLRYHQIIHDHRQYFVFSQLCVSINQLRCADVLPRWVPMWLWIIQTNTIEASHKSANCWEGTRDIASTDHKYIGLWYNYQEGVMRIYCVQLHATTFSLAQSAICWSSC